MRLMDPEGLAEVARPRSSLFLCCAHSKCSSRLSRPQSLAPMAQETQRRTCQQVRARAEGELFKEKKKADLGPSAAADSRSVEQQLAAMLDAKFLVTKVPNFLPFASFL